MGGIFFDDLEERPQLADARLDDRTAISRFSAECLASFGPAYIAIMQRRKDMPFTEQQKERSGSRSAAGAT